MRALPSRDHPTQLDSASLLLQDYVLRRLTRHQSGGLGMQDNIHNEQVSQLLPGLPASVTSSAPRQEVRERVPLLWRAWPRSDASLCLHQADQLGGGFWGWITCMEMARGLLPRFGTAKSACCSWLPESSADLMLMLFSPWPHGLLSSQS